VADGYMLVNSTREFSELGLDEYVNRMPAYRFVEDERQTAGHHAGV
jgi:hypothetical protein